MAKPSITCYIQPEKKKSKRILEAFAAGCGAKFATTNDRVLKPGIAVFYGVRDRYMHLLKQAIDEGREWYYIDNSWFDVSRGTHYRVGHNAMQTFSKGSSNGKRLQLLGIHARPWRKQGRDIIVCSQSEEYMRHVANWPNGELGWRMEMQKAVRRMIGYGLIHRTKQCPRPLSRDLNNAFMLITHSSASAVQSLIHGIPIVVTDPNCIAAPFSGSLSKPAYPEGRTEWLRRLADSQWTLEEMRSGLAWRMLNGLG